LSFVAFVAASIFCGPNFRPHSVRSKPGETELTRIFGEHITANAFERWMAALFVTAYGSEDPEGLMPAILAVVINAPSVFSSSSFEACISHKWDLTLYKKHLPVHRSVCDIPTTNQEYKKHLSQSSSTMPSSRLLKFVTRVQPALETTTSRRPNLSTVSRTSRWIDDRSPTSACIISKRGDWFDAAVLWILCNSSNNDLARDWLFA